MRTAFGKSRSGSCTIASGTSGGVPGTAGSAIAAASCSCRSLGSSSFVAGPCSSGPMDVSIIKLSIVPDRLSMNSEGKKLELNTERRTFRRPASVP